MYLFQQFGIGEGVVKMHVHARGKGMGSRCAFEQGCHRCTDLKDDLLC